MNEELALEKGLIHLPSGYLLICKVFLSKCIHDINKPTFETHLPPSEIWEEDPVDHTFLNVCIGKSIILGCSKLFQSQRSRSQIKNMVYF